MALSDYQQLVRRLIGGTDATASDGDVDDAIGLALVRYSADMPRVLIRDTAWLVPGYLGPLPAGWETASKVLSAEYPIGRQPPRIIPASIYEDDGGAVLVTVDSLPAAAEVRISFSAPHLLTDQADTIPLVHREAVASYAAHSLCRQLAARFSGERESSINADGSNTDSRARNYAARAKEYRAVYYGALGKPDPALSTSGQTAGSGATPAASVGSWPGRPRNSLTRMGLYP